MGVRNKVIKGGNGINITKEVDSSVDYSGITNGTYFIDLSINGGMPCYKNNSGGVVQLLDADVEFEVNFVEIEQVLQKFRNPFSITSILTHNVDSLAYDLNESASFTTLTLPDDLPLDVASGDTITWQISYSSGKDKASINILGNNK